MKVRGQLVHTVQERIKRLSVPAPNGCWQWVGVTRNGYGRMTVGSRGDGTRRAQVAHRAAYEAFVGPTPASLEVCHRCDNPGCVNPEHLFLGSRQDNVDDRVKKGRNNHVVGSRIGTAKLTEATVIQARRMRADGLAYQKIADVFGIHKTTAMDACKGDQWAHVPAPPEKQA